MQNRISLSDRPLRGVGAVVLGAGPAHAFYFSTYEFAKEKLSELNCNDNLNYSKFTRDFRSDSLTCLDF
jgi:hypothetical protein